MQNYDSIWEPVYAELSKKYSDTIMNLWFSDIRLVGIGSTGVVMLINSDMKADILTNRYRDVFREIFENVMGFAVNVVILSDEHVSVDEDTVQMYLKQGEEVPAASEASSEKKEETTAPVVPETNETEKTEEKEGSFPFSFSNEQVTQVEEEEGRPASFDNSHASREYTFENFIVGGSNKFAHAACIAICQGDIDSNNPLFIYGPSGIGKTHLLYAIRNRIHKNDPDKTIVYVKGEEFSNEMIDSIQNSQTAKFRNKYRKADILLIDDIHFIAGKEGTQEEFFNTFNALYEEQKAMVFTSDRPPKDMKRLEDRLRTRFEWGVIADIQPPDYELRIAILKRKAQLMNIDVSMEILIFLADKLKGNIRQIEGAIKRLGAYQKLTKEKITLENTKEILSDIISGPMPESVKIEKILSAVARKYGITIEDLKSKKRSKEIALARHICIYIVRNITDKSLPEIGKIFNRDHTTAISSIEVITKKMEEDIVIENEVNDLIKEITSLE